MQYKISVVCVYNDNKAYEEMLVSSLSIQNIEYELVGIDNTDGRFKSASEALNFGASRATGEILIFSHQDISLKGEGTLRCLAEYIISKDIGDIVGAQGAKEKDKNNISNITAGKNFDSKDKTNIKSLVEVACVDEGLFGMLRETYNLYKFDETICNSWHLYSVEVCLKARKAGHKVWVAPCQAHHYSMGHISIDYMRGLIKLSKVYRKDFKYIWTTCYKVQTNRIYVYGLYFIWVIHRKLIGKSLN